MIIPYSRISQVQRNFKNKKIVLVGGCFDIFHFGHLYFLEESKKMGDILVVMLESDEFIKGKKIRNPIHSQEQRARLLDALRMVDIVIMLPLLKTNEYEKIVLQIQPNSICVTQGDPLLFEKEKQAEMVGGKVITFPKIKGLSSSQFI